MNMLSLQVVLVLTASLAGLCCVDAAAASLRRRTLRSAEFGCAAVLAFVTGALVVAASRLGGAA
jgi:hypothetical protein